MHLSTQTIFYKVVALFWFFLLSSYSYSQNHGSGNAVERSLMELNEDLVNSNSLFLNAPCAFSSSLSTIDLLKHALVNDRQGNWQCSKATLQAVSDKQKTLSTKDLCALHLVLAEYFTWHQQYDSAKLFATLANKEAGENLWSEEKAHALLLLSTGDLKQRKISSAYALADSALVEARQASNVNLEGKILFHLALCARRHFTAIAKRSFPYFLEAREKAIETADSLLIGTIDLYLSADLFETNKWVEGLPYFREGIQLALRNHDIYQTYLAEIAMGYAFELTEHPREALPIFIKALQLSQHQQAAYEIQHCYDDIAKNYKSLHQYDSALLYANLSANVPGIDSFWANVWELKASIYNDMGEYKTATAMYKKSIDWYREDFLYRNQDQLSGYEAKLNTKEKELQVTQQKKRALQLEWMVGCIGCLLVMSGWAFTVQRKAKGKLFLQNALIETQRSELEQSLGQKEILLKEIHHRVKNNLSVISSLLELQSSSMTDETAKAAIAVGQNRVASIALIHQRLYQHDNLAAIELNGFLQDLFRQVSSIFKNPGTTIQMEINVPETLLDIDTAVPLGLILNELITNSFKYAINSYKEGLIKIDLEMPDQGSYQLTYHDNGPGIRTDINVANTMSLGLRLIKRLSKQLGGQAIYKYNNGSTFVIDFKDSLTRNNEA